jgi:hypothetical protein
LKDFSIGGSSFPSMLGLRVLRDGGNTWAAPDCPDCVGPRPSTDGRYFSSNIGFAPIGTEPLAILKVSPPKVR